MVLVWPSPAPVPTASLRIGTTHVLPVTSVRDLAVYIDSDASMRVHVIATVRACCAALRQLRNVRRRLSDQALLTLIRAVVVSKVDYYDGQCSSASMVRTPAGLLNRLQSVVNARLVFSERRSQHITVLLRDLHW